jgi:hypothetical protein
MFLIMKAPDQSLSSTFEKGETGLKLGRICIWVKEQTLSYTIQVAVTILKDLPIILLCVFIVLWFTYKMGVTCFYEPCHKRKKSVS